jgi:hypothetical protein
MGTLAAALAEAGKPSVGKCSIGQLIDKLDDLDRQALLNAFSSELKGEQIAAALRSEGHQVQGQTIQRHRRGGCNCDIS